MANEERLALLKQGVEVWNAWRQKNNSIRINLLKANLSGADLSGADLSEAHLSKANLSKANLYGANLSKANLSEANLSKANLYVANLYGADLSGAHLSGAHLYEAYLYGAHLYGAHLSGADLSGANLYGADLSGADLSGAHLYGAFLIGATLIEANLHKANLYGANLSKANLYGANLYGADLRGATLTGAQLVETNLRNATLTGCHIYGVSAWGLKLKGATQRDLIITRENEPMITVDNLEVAQFIYLLLHNEKIRDVFDTITSKAVLILGRFTSERKAILDAIREELRHRNYLPIVFDFEKPASRDRTETISTLAHMARFIIADITDAKSIPQELQAIVPNLPGVPIQPLLQQGADEYGMFEHFKHFPWVLQTHEYQDSPSLISALPAIIAPADKMVDELRSRS